MERRICNEDCFHCIYPDCIATPKKELEKEERLREQRRRYYLRKKAEKEKARKAGMV